MQGKRGLIMGVANDHSIAWGIAKTLSQHGAELAFTYQGEALGRRVAPLAQSLGSDIVVSCDVEDIESVDAAFDCSGQEAGTISISSFTPSAFPTSRSSRARYVDVTTRDNFSRTMVISCFSFTEIAQRAARRMKNGGSLLTLTYGGSTRVMPNYNVMGVAKAALEASVRYIASDLGPTGIRCNAISAGPVRTLAGAGIADARLMYTYQKAHAPLRRTVTIEDVGGSALYLLSDLSNGVTGEIHYVDSGYNTISMPRPDMLKAQDAAGVTGAED